MSFRLMVMTLLCAFAVACPPARAGFVIGTASNYAVLTGPGIGNFQLTSDTYITGNIGVGSSNGTTSGTNNNIQFGGATLDGTLYLGGTYTNGIGGTATGGIVTQSSAVATAYNTVNSLSTTLAGEAGTTLGITGSAQTIAASSGTLDSMGDRVFTVTANNFGGYGPLTISGSASDYVVINITGNQNFNFDKSITLTGGITSDQVLFNITGTENIGAAAGGASIYGIILGIHDKFNMDAVNIEGRIFGGASGQDFQLVSNFNLEQPQTEQPNTPGVPEPSSIVLIGIGGIACLAGYSWRNRKRIAADR